MMSNEQLFCHLITDEVYFEDFLAYIDLFDRASEVTTQTVFHDI